MTVEGYRGRGRALVFCLLGIPLYLLGWTQSVWAIQAHGPPEGLYAHQMAHMAFLGAMVYIWFRTRYRGGDGWRPIRLSFIFFALWNLNTLFVHALAGSISPDQFLGSSGELPRYFIARSGLDVYFFLGKMDHFLFVPGAICLGLGLKKLNQSGPLSP
jgi:hypothetical protein